MTKDIRGSIRQIASNDSARAIVATATGELIKTLGTHRQQPEQQERRVVASGLGGFAAGAGAATLATTAVKRIGKLIGRRRRPLFADAPKKARKAVEVPKEAVDRVASGLRDQVSGSSRSGRTASRPAAKPSARKPSASGTRTRAKSTRSSNGSSGRTSAKSTRSSNGSSGRKSGASKSSASGTRTRAKSTRSSNGSSGRSRAAASGRR